MPLLYCAKRCRSLPHGSTTMLRSLLRKLLYLYPTFAVSISALTAKTSQKH